MLHDQQKKPVLARLRRVEGQVTAIHRMVQEEEYCIDVLLQVAAAQGALAQVSRLILSNHIQTCVRDAFEHGDRPMHDKLIGELMDLFSRYARVGPARR